MLSQDVPFSGKVQNHTQTHISHSNFTHTHFICAHMCAKIYMHMCAFEIKNVFPFTLSFSLSLSHTYTHTHTQAHVPAWQHNLWHYIHIATKS